MCMKNQGRERLSQRGHRLIREVKRKKEGEKREIREAEHTQMEEEG